MIVELTQEVEGPEGTLPVGHRINDPLAWVHVVNGIAQSVDDEAREKAEVERLRGQARRERKRREAERKRLKEKERRERKKREREERIKRNIKLQAEAAAEVAQSQVGEDEEPHGTVEQDSDSGG